MGYLSARASLNLRARVIKSSIYICEYYTLTNVPIGGVLSEGGV